MSGDTPIWDAWERNNQMTAAELRSVLRDPKEVKEFDIGVVDVLVLLMFFVISFWRSLAMGEVIWRTSFLRKGLIPQKESMKQ